MCVVHNVVKFEFDSKIGLLSVFVRNEDKYVGPAVLVFSRSEYSSLVLRLVDGSEIYMSLFIHE